MPSTAAVRPRGPELGRNTLPSFGAALAMHALLVLGMWFAVQWRTSSEAPAVAELWEPLAPIQPPTPAPEAPPPAPPQPVAAQPDADIVQQQQVKKHAPEQESPPPIERQPISKPEPRKIEPKKVEQKKEPSREQIERQERAAEERRQAEIARLTGEVTGSARAQAASPGVISNAYIGLVKGCILPHIVFAVPEGTSDQVYAEFQVDLLPTGEQAAAPKLVKPSGLPGWDDAAERAIIRCDPFPRQSDGTAPRSISLIMRPTEMR